MNIELNIKLYEFIEKECQKFNNKNNYTIDVYEVMAFCNRNTKNENKEVNSFFKKIKTKIINYEY